MNEAILNKVLSLKECLKNDERIIILNDLEKRLENDESVIALAYKKDMATTMYEDALKHYKSDSEEVSIAQKNLYEAKKKLDENPLVKQYNKAYKEVWLLYKYINKEIFDDFLDNKNKEESC